MFRLGTKVLLNQQGKISHKHGIQQPPHEAPTISVPTGAKEAGTEPSMPYPNPSAQESGLRLAEGPSSSWKCLDLPTWLWPLGPTVITVSGPLRRTAGIVLPVAPAGHLELYSETHCTH